MKNYRIKQPCLKGLFKKFLGAIFILVGIAIISGYDKVVEIAVLDSGYFDVTEFEQSIRDNEGLEE